MLGELPLAVEMPLGVAEDDDFTPFLAAFQVERPYGLRKSSGPEPELSKALSISTPLADPAARLHAVMRARVRYLPAGPEPPRIELQPLPLEQVLLGERLGGSTMPDIVIYGNVETSSVEEAVNMLLEGAGIEPGEITTLRAEYLAGTRWLTVKAGTFLGRPEPDAALAGRRRLDLMVKDRQGFYLNPAHFLFQWPLVDAALDGHPLLSTLIPVQHRLLFATKSRMLFVRKNSPNPTVPYGAADTAARMINDALVEAQPGDVVVVIDNAVYDEKIFVPDGVALTSTAVLGTMGQVSESPAAFPTLNDPNALSAAVVLEDLARGPTHVSGFIIAGGRSSIGGGIRITDCYNVEVAQNDIHHNEGVFGGGVGVMDSRRVSISDNVVRDNSAPAGTGLADYGQGGGIYVGGSSTEATVRNNAVYRNSAANFGGGVAVILAREVRIRNNRIGGPLSSLGNRVIGDRLPYQQSVLFDNPQGGGGGVGVFDTSVQITDNEIRHNEAHVGGGIEFYVAAGGYVARNEIEENRTRPEVSHPGFPVGGDGGGVAVNNTALTEASADRHRTVVLHNNHIRNNQAEQEGGGVYGTAKALIRIYGDDHRIISNSARGNGGGVRVSFGSQLRIEGGEIRNNRCLNSSGKDGGGGVAARNSQVHVQDCVIQGNSVNNFGGGGVYIVTLEEGDPIPAPGVPSFDDILQGSYGFAQAEIRLIDCNVTTNAANGNRGAGGGLYVVYDQYDVRVRIDGTTLNANTATHTDPEKAFNVVFQDNSTIVFDPIDNDTDLSSLTPLNDYENTFEP